MAFVSEAGQGAYQRQSLTALLGLGLFVVLQLCTFCGMYPIYPNGVLQMYKLVKEVKGCRGSSRNNTKREAV